MESFRFTDNQLQADLIQSLNSTGIRYRVKDDGSVLYSEDTEIDQYVERIIERVFPVNRRSGYYRTQIRDKKKAERYRNFKKRTGSKYIEEVWSGRSYFVQALFEKLYRHRDKPTHLSYCLRSPAFDPDEVTKQLELIPSCAVRKGEALDRPHLSFKRKGAPERLSDEGFWELCSIGHIESNDIILHFEWLLGLIEPRKQELSAIKANIVETDFAGLQTYIVEPRSEVYSTTLDNLILTRLNNHCDWINISFWPDDYL